MTDTLATLARLHRLLRPDQPIVAEDWPCVRLDDGRHGVIACDKRTGERPRGARVDLLKPVPWPVYVEAEWPPEPRWQEVLAPHASSYYSTEHYKPIPDYSTYAGMGLVLDAMTARGFYVPHMHTGGGFYAEFRNGDPQKQVVGDIWEYAEGDTLPQAVVVAAIAALEAN